MVLAREDLRQVDLWEGPMVSKAERGGDGEQVEGLETVFEAERDKVRSERRMWEWVAGAGGVAAVLGVGVAWAGWRASRWSAPRGPASST